MDAGNRSDETQEDTVWPPVPTHQVQPTTKKTGKLGPRIAPFIALAGTVPALINCLPIAHNLRFILEIGWIVLMLCVAAFVLVYDKIRS